MNSIGNVYLVGAGCGKFDLITLRGMEYIKNCDCIVYDSLVDKRLLDYARSDTELINVGKRAGKHSFKQEEISDILVKKALAGKNVTRLKGGDPFVFGRGGEEITALKKHGIPYCLVPGISSSIAVPELAGIPVTHRKTSRSFHVITGHTKEDFLPENMNLYAQLEGTLVFLMGLGKLELIAQKLMEYGKSPLTPAAVICNGGQSSQKTVRSTLQNISEKAKENGIVSPAVIVIGDTADFDFSSTVSKPLDSISVTVTGTKALSQKLSEKLNSLGADVTPLEFLTVNAYENNAAFDKALADIESYNYIVLTSNNGGEIFFERLRKLKIDLRRLSEIIFAVIGSGTAKALENKGIFADIIPKEFTSECLAKLLAEKIKPDEKALILRAEKGSEILTRILDSRNISYDDIKTYDVNYTEKGYEKKISTDFITFASSSGVRAFFENGFEISPDTQIVCIGGITAECLKKYTSREFFTPKECSAEGMVNLITEKSWERNI
ncbi:MAG: uroporphyrinogen-III C-methyltransferase [Oscillospiraceae bacterium]